VDPLFANAPDYVDLPLVGAGVAATPPEDADLLRGWHRETRLPPTAPALVVWLQGYGTRVGDVLTFRLRDPNGALVVDHGTTLERGHARGSYYAGARRPEGGWPSGRYTAVITWHRDGISARRQVTLEIAAAPPAP